jgi:hypothetical protein
MMTRDFRSLGNAANILRVCSVGAIQSRSPDINNTTILIREADGRTDTSSDPRLIPVRA